MIGWGLGEYTFESSASVYLLRWILLPNFELVIATNCRKELA